MVFQTSGNRFTGQSLEKTTNKVFSKTLCLPNLNRLLFHKLFFLVKLLTRFFLEIREFLHLNSALLQNNSLVELHFLYGAFL